MSENYLSKKRALAGSAWIITSFILANMIVLFVLVPFLYDVFVSMGAPMQRWLDEKNIVVLLIGNYLYVPIALALIYVVFNSSLKGIRPSIKAIVGIARGLRLNDIPVALLAYVTYYAIAICVFIVISLLLPEGSLSQAQELGINDPSILLEYVLAFIMFVVLAPIVEEILFRGYLYGTLRSGFSILASALVTSILFGLAHGQINVAIDTFILSMVLCYLRERTGAIWAGMLVHALKNAVAFVLLFVLHIA
jgi:membrane protease YdiL (CAAX protease family)